jgi:hypothetical protein
LTSVTWEGPSASQCSTSDTQQTTLHLNAFRGEPAISAFDWHFTRLPTIHPSILQHTPVRASTGFYPRFPLTMGRSRSFGSLDSNHARSLRTRFRSACGAKPLKPPLPRTRRVIMQKARHHRLTPALTVCRHIGFRFCFTPLPGCFSPFPHGTGALSVALCI